jgi:DnaK suppressor protein
LPRASKASRASKPAKTAGAKKTGAQKAAGRKVAARRTTVKTPAKKVAAKKAAPAKSAAKKAPAKRAVPKAPARTARPAARAPAKKAPAKPPRRVVKDKFILEQEALLHAERATYVEQAEALKAEADQLAAEMEPGDIQFDDESGEGATATVDRERDLALSAQARQEVEEIDHALAKINAGTYGACENCGQPIPRARLKAIPHARLCIACKSGGLSRR